MAVAIATVALAAAAVAPADATGARVERVTTVAGAIARRNLRLFFTNPALLLPGLVFPLIFLMAFAGGLSNLGNVRGFDLPSGYTAFQFVFVLLQAAAFGGVFTGFGIAADFESGFARRLLLGRRGGSGSSLGYVGSGIVRFCFTGLGRDRRRTPSPACRSAAAALTSSDCSASASSSTSPRRSGARGLSYRFKTVPQAAPLMQTPVFVLLFLAPVYVPLSLLDGWIHTVASWNPVTALLEAGRGFVDGSPYHSGLCVPRRPGVGGAARCVRRHRPASGRVGRVAGVDQNEGETGRRLVASRRTPHASRGALCAVVLLRAACSGRGQDSSLVGSELPALPGGLFYSPGGRKGGGRAPRA